MRNPRSKVLLYAFFLAIIDQISKYFVLQNFKSAPLEILGPNIGFQYSENYGIAFSIAIPPTLIILLNVVLFFVIFRVFQREFNMQHRIAQWGVALIIGGGIGNIIDRLTYGYVVDFIALWSYPRFNLADTFISIGVLLLILFYGKIRRV